jgi:hypothetical protein
MGRGNRARVPQSALFHRAKNGSLWRHEVLYKKASNGQHVRTPITTLIIATLPNRTWTSTEAELGGYEGS